ncbi:DoxX family protein [Romeria aff. gracilis LEGE 07310]|uniref:DoxX family protein n=1 Tax=Vasconcelosia minhoensis LEGE 07310 TaxID=915328 RepID=A0A8J7AA04_9CYAN|nr:DoxX family protein [Romeria gracilis]MBE9076826.1 DoxX family protein [Romeria aff. gracilis LEGE 07310]
MQYIPLAARIFLSILFLKTSIGHLIDFPGFQQDIADAGLPLAPLLAVGTIVFQLLGGLSLLIGFKTRIGATLLILFLIPASIFFHNPFDPSQLTNFLKNLALIGGLLMVIYAGAGALSVDGPTSPASSRSY